MGRATKKVSKSKASKKASSAGRKRAVASKSSKSMMLKKKASQKAKKRTFKAKTSSALMKKSAASSKTSKTWILKKKSPSKNMLKSKASPPDTKKLLPSMDDIKEFFGVK